MDIASYRYVFANLWNLLRTDIQIAPSIKDASDPRWVALCDRYDAFVAQAPASVRDMADSMMRVQLYELESTWRWKDDKQQQTA
jgi:hypothetical protein